MSDPSGKETVELDGTTQKGINVVSWNGRVRGGVVAGDYRIVVKVDGKEYTSSVKVETARLND